MSAESSEKLAKLAGALLDDDDPMVRSLAGSVLRQFEPDPNSGPSTWGKVVHRYHREKNPKFWEGFWVGMWACLQK